MDDEAKNMYLDEFYFKSPVSIGCLIEWFYPFERLIDRTHPVSNY
jgi:hypothetical protein